MKINLPTILLIAGSFTLMSYEKSGFEMTPETIEQGVVIEEVYNHNPIMIDASFASLDAQDNQLVLSSTDEEKFKGFLGAILTAGI